MTRLAEAYEEHLQDPDGAIDAYSRALSRDASRTGVIENLIRLFELSGENQRLVEVLHTQVEILESPESRRDCYVRIASIRQKALNDGHGAISIFKRALEEDPYHLPTLNTLIELQLELAQWEDAATSLRDKLELVEDEGEQRSVYAQLATLMEGRLENTSEAISSLQAALDVDPSDAAILTRLCNLYEREGDWNSLMSLLEQQQELALEQKGERDDAIDIRIAKILIDKVDDGQQAVERLADVLERSPEYNPTVGLLEELLGDEELRENVCVVLETYYASRSQVDLARIIEAQITVTHDEHDRLVAETPWPAGWLKPNGGGVSNFDPSFRDTARGCGRWARLESAAHDGHLLESLAELYLEALEEDLDISLQMELNAKLDAYSWASQSSTAGHRGLAENHRCRPAQ